jgi:hypothetical protein
VPGRRDFVEAAPTLPADPRLRLPPASPRRYDGREIEVFHLHSDKQRLVAHVHRRYKPGRIAMLADMTREELEAVGGVEDD